MGWRFGGVCAVLLAGIALAGAQPGIVPGPGGGVPPAAEPPTPAAIFYNAINENNLVTVQKMLAADPTLAVTAPPGQCGAPLIAAAQNADTTMIETLIAAGAKVNVHDGDGVHPLDFAAIANKVANGELLLAKGAAIEARDHDGMTALLNAVFWGSPEFVDMLLAKDPTVIDRSGHTILLYAAVNGKLKLILTALPKDNIKRVDKNGDTVLHNLLQNANVGEDIRYGGGRDRDLQGPANDLATELATLPTADAQAFTAEVGPAVKDLTTAETIFLIKRGAEVNVIDEAGYTPLLEAALLGNLDTVQALLDHGARLDVVTDDGMTPAWAAAASGNAAMLQLLADKGCALTTALEDGSTPLHAAARVESKAAVLLLLAKGADVQALDDAEETPLFDAIHNSPTEGNADVLKDEIVPLLLEHGSSVTAQNNQGDTPLHVAINEQRYNIIPLLIAKGAKLDTKNHDGITPQQLIDNAGPQKAMLKKAVGQG